MMDSEEGLIEIWPIASKEEIKEGEREGICPLCDMKFEGLASHFGDFHSKELSFYCIPCGVTLVDFQSLIFHYHDTRHLYKTGKLSGKVKALTEEVLILQGKLKDLTSLYTEGIKKVIELQEQLSKRG